MSSLNPQWIRENIFNLAIVVIVVMVIGVFAYALLSGTAGILEKLSRTETARGLITFISTFGVISIAFILILALFFSKSADIINRFDKAKEVYTGLIVILGTIMGFYFGVEVGANQTEAVVEAISNNPSTLGQAAEPEATVPVAPENEVPVIEDENAGEALPNGLGTPEAASP